MCLILVQAFTYELFCRKCGYFSVFPLYWRQQWTTTCLQRFGFILLSSHSFKTIIAKFAVMNVPTKVKSPGKFSPFYQIGEGDYLLGNKWWPPCIIGKVDEFLAEFQAIGSQTRKKEEWDCGSSLWSASSKDCVMWFDISKACQIHSFYNKDNSVNHISPPAGQG